MLLDKVIYLIIHREVTLLYIRLAIDEKDNYSLNETPTIDTIPVPMNLFVYGILRCSIRSIDHIPVHIRDEDNIYDCKSGEKFEVELIIIGGVITPAKQAKAFYKPVIRSIRIGSSISKEKNGNDFVHFLAYWEVNKEMEA